MHLSHVVSISHSNSLSIFPRVDEAHVGNSRSICRNAISMGPVATAIVMFVAEKAIQRTVKGQLMRKGVVRKMRRLSHLVLELNNSLAMLYDMLEDMFAYL